MLKTRYSSEFMFPEYPSLRELYVAKMDMLVANLNFIMDKTNDTSYELYEAVKVYKRMLEEFNETYEEKQFMAV